MKVFYLFHKGYNKYYLDETLHAMKSSSSIELIESELEDVDPMEVHGCDVLIYQTFPNELQESKFNSVLVSSTDDIFLGFKGLKILFDAHDEGSKDAFTRFSSLSPYPSTIKLFMDGNFLKKGHVVFRPDVEKPGMFLNWLHVNKPKKESGVKLNKRRMRKINT
jgi:hypothetical protein